MAIVGPGGVGLEGNRKQPRRGKNGRDQSEVDQYFASEVLIFECFAAEAQGTDHTGVERLLDLEAERFDKEDMADHFQPTTGASGTSADEHQ